jgi:acetyl esterase/lipase
MLSVLDLHPPPPDQRIQFGAHELQFGELRLPRSEGPFPLVLAIHGGFWRARYDLTHLGHLCAALTQAGYATFSIEYRRVGQQGGGYPGTLEDVALAADFLPELAKRFPIKLEGAVALGHSAGGHLALWLAGRHHIPPHLPLFKPRPFRFRGVVCLAGVSDLAEAFKLRLGDGAVGDFMGGSPKSAPEHYAAASPAQLLPLGVRQALVHGTEDDAVPYSLSQRYEELARAQGDHVTLRTLQGMGHFEPIDPKSRAWPVVRDAVHSAGA